MIAFTQDQAWATQMFGDTFCKTHRQEEQWTCIHHNRWQLIKNRITDTLLQQQSIQRIHVRQRNTCSCDLYHPVSVGGTCFMWQLAGDEAQCKPGMVASCYLWTSIFKIQITQSYRCLIINVACLERYENNYSMWHVANSHKTIKQFTWNINCFIPYMTHTFPVWILQK